MPTAAPVSAASEIGVSITRSGPNSAWSPSVALNAAAETDVLAEDHNPLVVEEGLP